MTTYTITEINALSRQELELAVVIAQIGAVERSTYRPFEGTLMTHVWASGRGPYRYNYLNDTDAALALLVETGWIPKLTLYASTGVYVTLMSPAPVKIIKGMGATVSEAALRCWLRWHQAQEEQL